ncbi:hypothetical protein NC651_011451 [Populus alba x Populus x berolinensis]|nr:hypothetical protein NC651_011451 [Populus alba x Populus x berolinensis]
MITRLVGSVQLRPPALRKTCAKSTMVVKVMPLINFNMAAETTAPFTCNFFTLMPPSIAPHQ